MSKRRSGARSKVLSRAVLHDHAGPDAAARQAGLRLDSAAAFSKGGESGPVVTPLSPGESPLLEAVRYEGAIQMPPDGRLPAEALAALERWVLDGAPWPAEIPAAAAPASRARRRISGNGR